MKLTKLLDAIDPISITGDCDIDISSIEYDSRKVVLGSLFVCLKGFLSDGHQYAQTAAELGAAALLVEELPTFSTQAVIIQVKDTRKALAYLSAAWFDYPARQLTMIGLTGTKGKTTTAFMMKKILEEAGFKVGMIGTTGAYIGATAVPTKNTTPESFELHALFSNMLAEGCTHVVMETSSQGFKLDRTAGILFHYGAFLNLSPDHISPGEHESFDEYKDCKKMLFTQTGQAIVNTDADYWQAVTAAAKNPFLVSRKQHGDLTADQIENIWQPGLLGTSFLVHGAYEGTVILNMPGFFNVENALIAMGISAKMGISFQAVQTALRQTAVKGRTQLLTEASHFSTFIIDYAHNALSMESLLAMLKGYRPGRLICLFGGGGNRPRQRRYDMGLIAGKYADLTIITTDNPRFESPDSINEDIIKGLKVHNGTYEIIMDREKAIHYLIDHSNSDDIIALIGKGHEEYQEIAGQKYYFSEENIVSAYLMTK